MKRGKPMIDRIRILSFSGPLVLLWWIGSAVALEQRHNIRFDRLGLEEGLSQETVYDILQDRDGILWLATQEGLNRYDGYTIRTYLHEPDEPGTLSHDWVWTVLEDRSGTLWVGTDGGGLNRFDRRTGSFIHYRHAEHDRATLSNDVVRVVFEDRDDGLWVGTDGGLNRFDPETGTFRRFRHDPADPFSISDDRVRAVVQDRRGLLWVATDGGGLNQMDLARDNFHQFRHDPNNPGSLSSDRVRSLYEARDGMLWIGTYDGGLNRYNPRTGTFKHYQGQGTGLESDFVREMLQDHRGVLWVATDNGLHEYRPESDTFVRYGSDVANPKSLADNRTISLFQDAGEVLWVGTYAGLNKWNYQTIAFRLYRGAQANGLRSDAILAFAETNGGDWWIGTYEGLYRYRSESGMFELQPLEIAPGQPGDERITALATDPGGELWIGTRAGGLFRLDPRTGQTTHYPATSAPGGLSVGGVTALSVDQEESLWVATFGGGLYRHDRALDRFEAYRHDPEDPASLPSNRVVSILITDNGEIWVGTFGAGAARRSAEAGGFLTFTNEPGDKTSLSNNTVWAIHEDLRGNLWFGTQGGGLNLLPADQRTLVDPAFQRFGRRQGLRSQVVYGVLSDDQGNIWASSNRGLVRLVPSSGRVTHYDTHHGLQAYEFNSGAYLRTRRGEMLFGGSKGFNAFFPSEVRLREYKPPVVLTNVFKVNEPLVRPGGLQRLEHLDLAAEDYLVTFEFSGLDYSSPGDNAYRYKLEGYDTDWIESGSVRRASYTNLPSGQYRFMVLAAGPGGVWSDPSINLDVIVHPPWYLSPVAYLAYALGLIAALLAGYALHRRRLAREASLRVELEREISDRTQELVERGLELEERNRELRALNTRLEETSITDPLTGLNNRRFVREFMQKTAGSLDRRLEKLPLATVQKHGPRLFCIVLDVDGFKPQIERFGPAFGDRVLERIGRDLRGLCREADLVARWGEDQFLLVGETADVEIVMAIAERLVSVISEIDHRTADNELVRITITAGLTLYPFSIVQPHLFTWEQVTAISQQATVLGKQKGGNRCVGIGVGSLGLSRGDFKKILSDPDGMERRGAIKIHFIGPGARATAVEDPDETEGGPHAA